MYSVISHTTDPCITTCRYDNENWVKLSDPSPLKHNFTTSAITGSYMETYRFNGVLYMAIALQYQPFMKVYTWDSLNEMWTDENINPLFPVPTGAVYSPDIIYFKNNYYLILAHAVSPYVSVYKLNGKDRWDLMIRPTTLPVSTGNGARSRFIMMNYI